MIDEPDRVAFIESANESLNSGRAPIQPSKTSLAGSRMRHYLSPASPRAPLVCQSTTP